MNPYVDAVIDGIYTAGVTLLREHDEALTKEAS